MHKKIIVITGAAGGVGSKLALGLAKNGHHIVAVGRSSEKLLILSEQINTAAKQYGGSASFEVLDMMDTDAITCIGEKIKQTFKRIDVWINNVGVNNHNAIGPSWELDAKHWCDEVAFNLFTAYQGTSAAIRLMQEHNAGYIFNLGGGGAEKAKPFNSAYGAAKTAIVRFTETVNQELAQEKINIKVFAFNPGFIKNDRTENLVESEVCRQYMPNLEDILKHGEMSNAQDSVDLIAVLMSGKADQLAGRYFFSDDKNIVEAIAESDKWLAQNLNLLRVQ